MKYSQYKESGIDWIDVIPEHWETKMFKGISYMKGRIGWQGLKFSEFSDDVTLPYLITGMNFKDGKIRWDEVYHISEERYNEAPEIQLKDYDILMTKDGTIGKLLYIDNLPGKASLNSHLLLLRPLLKSYFPKFLYYQLQSSVFFGHIEYYKYGTTFYGLSQESMGKFITILPSYSEQTAIAQYLDRKTTAVDKKIEILQQKIETYKKLRKALITKAVTKGLQENAEMKESEIDWIGIIPKHWEVKRVKDIFNTISGGTPSTKKNEFWSGNIPWIPSGKVQNNEVLPECVDEYISEEALSGTKIASPNSVLIALTGATCSNIGYLHFETAINQSIVAISKKKNLVERFYFYFLISGKEKIRTLMTGGAQGGINQEDVKFFEIVFPPKKEQQQIAEFLDKKTVTIDKIVANLQTQISTLQQVRKVLINDAVTGKIKVV